MTKSNSTFFNHLYKLIYSKDIGREYEKECFSSNFEYILKSKINFDHTSKISRKKLYKFLDGLDIETKNRLIEIATEYGRKYTALQLLSEDLYGHLEHSHDDLYNFVEEHHWNKFA
jgi:hypothetical protein